MRAQLSLRPKRAFYRHLPANLRRFGAVVFRRSGQLYYRRVVMAARSRAGASEPANQIKMLSPSEFAKELGVDERTVRRWAAAGVLPAEHSLTGHHRLPASLVPALQALIAAKVPLNARTLRGRFDRQLPLEEEQRRRTD